ncbi:MAG: FAD:protein FMN transferase [Clostridia bacterium]|nr:FAD:protein FMN transferase [Clostridia bacterium]
MNFITKNIRAISIALFVTVVTVMLILTQSVKPTEKTFFAFDTLIDISLSGKNADKALEEIEFTLLSLEKEYSKYTTSPIKKFNSLPQGASLEISPEMAKMISDCNTVSKFTDGAFDITTSALSDLWDIKNATAPPSGADISAALEKTGWNKISLSGTNLTKTTAELDFGGILKGVAADKAREIANKYEIKKGIINLGGNVCLIGSKGKSPWTVGIVNPFSSGEVYLTVNAENTNVITSGAYQRYFEHDGKTYHHILSPQTGYPVENDIASVTVVSDNGTRADALSTAIFVSGTEKGMEIAKNYGVEVIIIKKDGSIFATEEIEYTAQKTS